MERHEDENEDALPPAKPPGSATSGYRLNADAQEALRFPADPDRTDPAKRKVA